MKTIFLDLQTPDGVTPSDALVGCLYEYHGVTFQPSYSMPHERLMVSLPDIVNGQVTLQLAFKLPDTDPDAEPHKTHRFTLGMDVQAKDTYFGTLTLAED